ncbi:MAG: alpha/beta hydrolase [Burkholderiaceae bacterium]|nr:alpha/beta hydrolase [Burkholderiaceae bacterium]MEB2318656.1 alpha/beta hydrolase [Pseudomonadota bacterium]
MPDDTLPEIRSGNYADLGEGIRLHYASAGEQGAPLMLFMHGFPEFWYAWKDFLPHYGRHRFAVAPDLRGYNLSSRPAEVEQYRIGRLIDDIDKLIKALGYRDAIVVAHDWGGALAWSVAISRPELISRLVMMNAPHPIPFARALATDPAQQAASQYMNWLRRPGSEDALAADDFTLMQKFLRGFSGADWLDGPTLAAYKEAWGQPGAIRGGVNWYRASPMYPPTDADPGAGRLELREEDFIVPMPTLLIWGEQDQALLPVLLDGIERVVPDLRMVRIPDATHWLAHEKPAQIRAAIDEFLGDAP